MVLLPIAANVVYRTWPALRNCWPSRVHACQQKVTLSCAIVRSSESPGARRDGRSRRRAPVARSRATYAADWSRHPRRSPDRMLHRRNGASFVRQIVAPSTWAEYAAKGGLAAPQRRLCAFTEPCQWAGGRHAKEPSERAERLLSYNIIGNRANLFAYIRDRPRDLVCTRWTLHALASPQTATARHERGRNS